MQSKKKLYQSIRSNLLSRPRSRHEAAYLSCDIMQYLCEFCDNEATANELRKDFTNYIEVHQFQDLLNRHIEYAITLASAERELIYEEMLKLFYLCDEIESLEALGLEFEQSEKNRLKQALKQRFAKEPRCVKIVAKQNCETWNSHWWWYQDNLEG